MLATTRIPIQTWDTEDIAIIAAIGGAVLVAVCWILAVCWRSVRRSEYRAQLTAMMLQRGMSAEDIARVLQAGVPEQSDNASANADPEVALVKELSEQGYRGDDVERILSAARQHGLDGTTTDIIRTLAKNWVSAGEIERVVRARGQAGRPAPIV